MGGIQTGLTDAQLLASQLKAHELVGQDLATQADLNDLALNSGNLTEAQAVTINENKLKGTNLFKNYLFENTIGTTPTQGNVFTPTGYLIGLNNSINLGYASDATNDLPYFKFNITSVGFATLGHETISDASTIANLKGKTVTVSFLIRHTTVLSRLYLYREINGVAVPEYTSKVVNTNFGNWYRVEFDVVLPSNLTSFRLSAYPSVKAPETSCIVDLSSFILIEKGTSLITSFIKNDSWENVRDNIISSIAKNNINTIINDGVQFSLPKTLPIVVGNKLEVFKHSLVRCNDADNYSLGYSFTGTIPNSYMYNRKFSYTPQAADASFNFTFKLISNSYTDIAYSQTVNIIPVAKKSSPVSQKYAVIIGDSFTAEGIYPTELKRRLVSSGGTPTADGLTNIEFVGKVTTGTMKTEGYSGKTWDYFTTSTSPFWNSATGQLDIDNYCSTLGITKLDYVFIMLGTNGMSSDSVISTLYNALIAHNPSIKIIQSGRIFGNPYGVAGETSYKQTTMSLNYGVLDYNRRLEALITSAYSSNIYFNDVLPVFDTLEGHKYIEIAANNRSSVLIRQTTDNVHPSSSGYLQIADSLYNAFHHYCLA